MRVGGYGNEYLYEDYALWLKSLANGCNGDNIQQVLVDMRFSKETAKRRGGIKYAISEIKAQYHFYRANYISYQDFIINIITRIFVRLLPTSFRGYIYKKSYQEIFMSSPLIPVILSGGNGTRLWPLSREEYPKQFLKLTDSISMLQSTISRLDSLNTSSPVVICNELHRFIVAEQLRHLNKLDNNIILEPSGRNTAPAICIAALILKMKHPNENPLMLVLPADHSVKKSKLFVIQ